MRINNFKIFYELLLINRDYIGHKEAVRDLNFSNDGYHFLSASYDKYVNYWDTETGKVISSFNTKKYPYCVRLNPE